MRRRIDDMYRHEINDEHWNRIKDLLPGQAGHVGVTAKDNRLFINAVLRIAKTGAPWRDLPERFGNWNVTVHGLSSAYETAHPVQKLRSAGTGCDRRAIAS